MTMAEITIITMNYTNCLQKQREEKYLAVSHVPRKQENRQRQETVEAEKAELKHAEHNIHFSYTQFHVPRP
jgi:hypothetical protein